MWPGRAVTPRAGRVPPPPPAIPLPPAQAGEEMAVCGSAPPPLAGEGRAAERGQRSEGAGHGAKRAFADPTPPLVDGEPVIRAHNLSKCYLIYDRPQDRLKQSIVPRLRRLIG